MDKSIIISGFGGQGVLFAGALLSHAATLENLQTTWIPSYGAEMRGGAANCCIKFSDDEIGSPLISKTDILIALNDISFKKFESKVKAGGLVIANVSEELQVKNRSDINYIFLPLNEITKKIKDPSFANVIAVGAFIKKTGVLKIESLISALNLMIPKKRQHLLGFNVESLLLGVNYIANLMPNIDNKAFC